MSFADGFLGYRSARIARSGYGWGCGCVFGGFGAGSLEAIAQLIGDRFQSGGLFGGSFDVVVDGEAAGHGFAANRHQGIVYFFGQLLQPEVDFGQGGSQLIIAAEFAEVEAGGQDVRIRLSSSEAIADKGEAFVAHFEQSTAFFDSEMNEKGEFGFDRCQGGFDVLKIGFREFGGDVLIGHGVKVSLGTCNLFA
jgi:hypothetical protein